MLVVLRKISMGLDYRNIRGIVYLCHHQHARELGSSLIVFGNRI